MNWLPPTLETERLVIRPLEERDATGIFLFCSNPNVTKFTLWDTHRTIEDSLFFVRQYAPSRYLDRVPEPMGLVLKNDPDQMVMGTIGCFWSSQSDGVMEMGYNVAELCWGRGLAVEAARRMIEHVFQEYPVFRLQIRTFKENTGSARVAQKLGFHLDGTLRSAVIRYGQRRDLEIYSLLRGENSSSDSL